MDKIKLFPGGFPLTVERLNFLQSTYEKAISQLTKLGGTGNMIIEGAVIDTAPTPSTISAGVVVINGEIMEFRGGDYNNTVSIFEEITEVPYSEDLNQDGNLDLKAADTVRFAQCGTGGVSSILYSSLSRISNLADLMPKIGDIKMIYRNYDPAIDLGWALCDGTNGTPNMVDRFPIGVGENALGATGGSKEVVLTTPQMPQHNHTGNTTTDGAHTHNINVREGVMLNDQNINAGGEGNDDTRRVDNVLSPNNTTNSAGAHNHSLNINNTGQNQAHENRPPFLAFNFLIFVGIA
jgi:microcystin-dependent protein